MLRASRTRVGSYEITCDDRPLCTWKPKVFRRAGTFVLDGRRYDVVARGWIELRPPGEPTRTLVLSALPSVTGFSRTSLLKFP